MEGRQSCAAVDLLNNGAVQQRVATDKVRKEWPLAIRPWGQSLRAALAAEPGCCTGSKGAEG